MLIRIAGGARYLFGVAHSHEHLESIIIMPHAHFEKLQKTIVVVDGTFSAHSHA